MTQVIQKKTNDLRLHPLQEGIPGPVESSEEWLGFCESLKGSGIRHPLIITDDDQIMDGGWRWRAAKSVKLATVPCIVEEETEARELIICSLFHRRDLDRGVRVYFALPLYADTLLNSRSKRAENLKNANVSRLSDDQTIGESATLLCAKWGIARDTFYRAVRIRRALDSNPAHKARWEPQLAAGQIGLEGVAKGIGGVEGSIYGKAPSEFTRPTQMLFEEIFEMGAKRWQKTWGSFSSHDKAKALGVVSQSFSEAPLDLLEGIKKSAEAAIRLRKEAAK